MYLTEFYNYISKAPGECLSQTNRVIFNHFVTENLIQPRLLSQNIVELSPSDLKNIENFALRKAKAKDIEWNGVDASKRVKREMTGATVEYALLKKYGRESYFDNSIVARSSKKNYPDLLPLGACCDVKGSSVNNVPLIFKTSRSYVCDVGVNAGKRYKCPNVIGVTDTENVWILGLATPTVLEQYSDENLIIIAENTTKTGFFGFDKLIDLPHTWESFVKLCWQSSIKV
jgi:hypothetical protein